MSRRGRLLTPIGKRHAAPVIGPDRTRQDRNESLLDSIHVASRFHSAGRIGVAAGGIARLITPVAAADIIGTLVCDLHNAIYAGVKASAGQRAQRRLRAGQQVYIISVRSCPAVHRTPALPALRRQRLWMHQVLLVQP